MTTNGSMNLTSDQNIVLDLVLDGQMGMGAAIAWALRTDQITFAEYLKTF